MSCEQTGNRPDFVVLSEELRKVTDEKGEKLFNKSEWLSPAQIKGCFAQFLSNISKAKHSEMEEPKKKKQRADFELKEVIIQEDENLSEVLNMLETNDFTNNVSEVVNNVLSEVKI